jgi:hypothetical protein
MMIGSVLRCPNAQMGPTTFWHRPCLYASMRGERVPKQTSAEATNGKFVSA